MSRMARATHRRQRWAPTIISHKTIHTCQYCCAMVFRSCLTGSLSRRTTAKTTVRKWEAFNLDILKRTIWRYSVGGLTADIFFNVLWPPGGDTNTWTIVLTVTIEPPTIQSTPPAPHISSSHTAWEPKKYGVNKRRGIKTEYRWQIAGYIWWDIAGAYYSLSSSPLIQCCVFRDTFLLCKWEKIPC